MQIKRELAKFSKKIVVYELVYDSFKKWPYSIKINVVVRGWLDDSGMNSDRDKFRSVHIQIILSDYMRPVQKLNSDRDDSFR